MTPEYSDILKSSGHGDEMRAPVEGIHWVDFLSLLWSSRRIIVMATVITTVGAVVVSLVLPKYYKSTATMLPESGYNKPAGLAGLSDLAALAGINVGAEGSLTKLYPTIINSEAVLKNVIYTKYGISEKRIDLIEYWKIEEETPERSYEVALEKIRGELEISLDNKTMVVRISIETRDPDLSAAVLNKILQELDEFMRTKRKTSASEQREWIEQRLDEVKGDLEKSENALKEFREKNRRIADSPQLLLEQRRMMREAEINGALFEELKKQHEITKIEEIKNIPIISVMDAARSAAEKNKPRRAVIVLVTFFLSGIGSMFWVVLMNRYGQDVRKVSRIFQRKDANEQTGPEAKP